MASEIPADLQHFVANNISSLHQLEALLLVSALPDREWSVDAVYGIVLSNITTVAGVMEDFVKAGFFVASGMPPLYKYAPRTEELGNQVATIGALYKTSRHKIVELIYHPRFNPLKSFSDAFKFKQND